MASVGGPWVAQRVWPRPIVPSGIVGLVSLGEAVNLAHRFSQAQIPQAVQHGDARAVVPPVFQSLEALKHDGPGSLATDVSYYAAHSGPGVGAKLL